MTCARCGRDNPIGEGLCSACGTPLAIRDSAETLVEPQHFPIAQEFPPTGEIRPGAVKWMIALIGAALVVGAILIAILALNRPADNTDNQVAAIVPSPSPTRTQQLTNPPANPDAVVGEVTDTLNEWAAAITARDPDLLTSHYADQIQPYYLAKSVSANKVRQDMARAYSTYETTTIRISNVSVEPDVDGVHATARFDKAFDFVGQKTFAGAVREEMWLTKTGGHWLITGLADLRVYYSSSGPVQEPTP